MFDDQPELAVPAGIAEAVFGPWAATDEDEADWDRALFLVTTLSPGTRTWRSYLEIKGRWQHARQPSPRELRELGRIDLQGANYPIVLALIADRGAPERGARDRVGPELRLRRIEGKLAVHLAELDLPQRESDLTGVVAEPGLTPSLRTTGAVAQDLVGTWRLRAAGAVDSEAEEGNEEASNMEWFNGVALPDLVPVAASIELTIRRDGSFGEVAETTVPGVAFFDGQGVMTHLGDTFDGFIASHDGADYVMDHESAYRRPPTMRRDDGDTQIVERLLRTGDTLIRIQNVVTDGLYQNRVVLDYVLK